MITLLSSIFIKDKENTASPIVRQAYGILCSIVGIVFNILLFIGKYLAGVLSGSIAITADAFNNLSDAASSLITLVGFRFSGLKPDSEHPFGHGRMEYLSGLGVSVLILLMGFELAKSSVQKILHPKNPEMDLLTVCILMVSIFVKLYMGFYNRQVGSKIHSATMHATATDSLSDAFATSMVLVSLLIYHFTGLNIDGYSGLIVACLILYAGLSALKDTANPILGQPADPELIQEIERIVLAHEEILGIHDLLVHDYGSGHLIISLHGEVDGYGNIFELHDAIDRIESELNEKLHCDSVIHMDPIDIHNPQVVIAKRELTEKIKEIHEGITIHDFRMVPGTTHTNFIFDAVIPFEAKMSEQEAKARICELVSREFEDTMAVVKIDRV